MGCNRGALLPLLLLVLSVNDGLQLVLVEAQSVSSADRELRVLFTEAPRKLSALSSAVFQFVVSERTSGGVCSNCSVSCKIDNDSSSNCNSGEITYTGLLDGNHSLDVCASGSQKVQCASYNWSVDTDPPTANISSASSFTSADNVSVNISFSEPCTGGGGFGCSDEKNCNLLVYGAGHVLPSTLNVIEPDLKFSLMVAINVSVQYGRLILAMDKSFCTDDAGNRFTRTSNSTLILHFDRRIVFMNLTVGIPVKLLQLNGMSRAVEATNKESNLRIYLSFSEPVLNTSTDILNVLHASSGFLVPTNRNTLGNRRFGYLVHNISSMSIVTITCDTNFIISRQGTPISTSNSIAFLYDTNRPSVRLSTYFSMRTREHMIPVLVKFVKPVFDFNSSAVLVTGGYLESFHEISKSIYLIQVHASDSTISVDVAENAATDVAGNKNLQSNHLQVSHYSIPTISTLVSLLATIALSLTTIVSALLAISTASLLSSGAFSKHSANIVSEPSRNLLRIFCHVQIFALSRWVAVTTPVEFYEFARGMEWSIPYLRLPWENSTFDLSFEVSSQTFGTYEFREISNLMTSNSSLIEPNLDIEPLASGAPLTAAEYMQFLENQSLKPEAVEYIIPSKSSYKWKYFGRNMFWLGVFGGGLIMIRLAILCILKFRRIKSEKQKEFGALVFPRFEIFLTLLSLPCISQASAAIIRGRTIAGIIVGIILLGMSTSFLIALLLFLSLGITLGKLLQYKEVHQEGQEFHWYQEIIRVTLGPGKRGQWTWRDQQKSVNLTKLGPLFEDLRGPPKYMLTQIYAGENRQKSEDQIIASDDETEDAEAPFIQKVFGILRIYYTFLESVKRVCIGVIAGAYSSSRPSKTPTLIILSITSFQLFFMVLKKPFIKKKVQLVEIISVACQVGLFVIFLLLLEKEFSDVAERRLGYIMLALFLFGFVAELINEWFALYLQVKRLSPTRKSFSWGLKTAINGLLLMVLPSNMMAEFKESISSSQGDGDSGVTISPIGQNQRNSGTSERSWIRQLRELAKASFSKEDAGVVTDPSTSTYRTNSFWTGKRSRSSSVTSSLDFKAKGDMKSKKGLYKDLEAIFSTK